MINLLPPGVPALNETLPLLDDLSSIPNIPFFDIIKKSGDAFDPKGSLIK
jgi:hypothetical protein